MVKGKFGFIYDGSFGITLAFAQLSAEHFFVAAFFKPYLRGWIVGVFIRSY